jgi:hypothetical protein
LFELADVKIISKVNTTSLDITTINKDDSDYEVLLQGRKERQETPENYGTLNDIDWK